MLFKLYMYTRAGHLHHDYYRATLALSMTNNRHAVFFVRGIN